MRSVSERFAIQEGLDEYYGAPDRPEKRDLSDQDIRRLGALMCNSLPLSELDNPSLVWMSDYSVGGRVADGPVVAELREQLGGRESFYDYVGFDPDQSSFFEWTSATSGAKLTAVPQGRNENDDRVWKVEFDNPDNKSTMYRRIFSHLGKSSLHDLTKSEIIWPEEER